MLAAGAFLMGTAEFVVGSFAGQFTGWRGPFWALAVLAGLAAVFVGRFIPAREKRVEVSVRAEARALRQGRR
ncbi:hypothetical protein [Streptomyces aquilus]|uniref:hypothetical protein n=1 Tax=Streptomyces aquilus TaxID=2548456 RepID=UPI001FCC4850|nr:hypothetical protein [Streptomyces aquilus]